jgi:proteasome lid subunit RPN8/RPN11
MNNQYGGFFMAINLNQISEVIFEKDFNKKIKSKEVLLKPVVLSDFFKFAASNPLLEVSGLLEGRLEGKYLLVIKVHNCKNSKSSPTTVEINTEEMGKIADKVSSGNYIVGWVHSHPSYGVFMSESDINVQRDFQNLFSDAVALVLDPYIRNKFSFKFFRLIKTKVTELTYKFLVNKYEA